MFLGEHCREHFHWKARESKETVKYSVHASYSPNWIHNNRNPYENTTAPLGISICLQEMKQYHQTASINMYREAREIVAHSNKLLILNYLFDKRPTFWATRRL